MEIDFIEIDIGGQAVLVPSMSSLPAIEIMHLSYADDPMKQFAGFVVLLRKKIAPEFVEQFNELNTNQMVALVSQWVERSTF